MCVRTGSCYCSAWYQCIICPSWMLYLITMTSASRSVSILCWYESKHLEAGTRLRRIRRHHTGLRLLLTGMFGTSEQHYSSAWIPFDHVQHTVPWSFSWRSQQADRSMRRTMVFDATFMTSPGVLVASFSRNNSRRYSVYTYTDAISAVEAAVLWIFWLNTRLALLKNPVQLSIGCARSVGISDVRYTVEKARYGKILLPRSR